MKTSITFLLFVLLTFFAAQSQTQTWQWAKRVGTVNDNNGDPFNPTYNEAISDVKADKQGNVYAVGYFYPNPTFVNVTNGLPTTGGYGGLDGYLIKYNSCGSVLWWRRLGSTGDDGLSSLVFDNDENIQVLSGAASTATIDGNNGIDTIISGGGTFIAKFDTAGNFINKLDVPNVGKLFITSQGDYFITNGITGVRVNTLGITTASYTYATVSVGVYPPVINGIFLDKNDNLYLSGYFDKTINIGGGTTLTPAGTTITPISYWGNSLIVKFSSTGSMLWYERSYSTITGGDLLFHNAVDSSGNVVSVGGNARDGAVIFGYTVNALTNGNKANVIYFLDANTGNLISAITGTLSLAGAGGISPYVTDHDNYHHCIGSIIGNSLTFNTTTYTTSTIGGGGQSCIGKLSATGNFININMLPQSGSQREAINGLDVNEQGNIYIGGMFGGTLDSAGTAVNIIGGAEDGFVAKYGFPCGSTLTTLSPLPPTSLTAQYQATLTNYVTWIDNANYETGFELWYNINGAANFSLLATLPANTTSYTHTGLSYTTTYCYKARAVNNIGASFFTNVGCAATPAAPTNTGTAPNAPLNLTAVNNGSLTNTIAWNDNSTNEDNFELWYTSTGNSTYSLLVTLPANTTSYLHTNLTYSTNYCYQVAATNSIGSAYSNTDCAGTPGAPSDTTSLMELSALNFISKVIPNPAHGECVVQYPPLGGTTLIELLNVSGQVLQTISVPALEKHTYDMQQQQIKLPAEKGLYFIKITTGVSKASTVKKVVVE